MEKARAREIFRMMDADGGSTVDPTELRAALSILSDADCAQMMAILDTDQGGDVDLDEWLAYLRGKKRDKGPARFPSYLKYLEELVCRLTKEAAVEEEASSSVDTQALQDRIAELEALLQQSPSQSGTAAAEQPEAASPGDQTSVQQPVEALAGGTSRSAPYGTATSAVCGTATRSTI